ALALASPPVTDAAEAWRLAAQMGDACWRLGRRGEALHHFEAAARGLNQLATGLPPTLKRAFMSVVEHAEVFQARARLEAGLPLRPEARAPEARAPAKRFNPAWAHRYPALIGQAPALIPVFHALDRVAGSESMVLIRGESGTGKELVASALHQNSPRAHKPFVRVNCAAFVEELLLSELFGHEQGAFTGAHTLKRGRFELADGGTLFLDEIGDISAKTQVALLRVLQEGVFERVGGEVSLRVNARVLCATHRDLEQMVREGAFRQDLYYRLRGVIIEVPPLRARLADLPSLVQHFLAQRVEAEAKPLRLSASALASLSLHPWPGNIRELENVIRNVALFADGPVVEYADLALTGERFPPPDEVSLMRAAEQLTESPAPPPPVVGEVAPQSPLDEAAWLGARLNAAGGLPQFKKMIEIEVIAMALRAEGGSITRAAARLGMKRPRLSQIILKDPTLTRIKQEAQS
ncbi:sigma-54 dependent transcriptional regulator, partial [Myxococcota bacterium]|nr:sigma-54 dependent transcriptional regulator [Myxococcota bacterium]